MGPRKLYTYSQHKTSKEKQTALPGIEVLCVSTLHYSVIDSHSPDRQTCTGNNAPASQAQPASQQ